MWGSGVGSGSLPLSHTGLRDGPFTMEDVTAFSFWCVDLIYIYITNKKKSFSFLSISLSFAGNSCRLTEARQSSH